MGTFIRDKLWLGAVEDAYDAKKLNEQGTTHILSIECSALRDDKAEGFSCLFIDAEDSAEEDLLHHFDDCFRFIETARQSDHGGVLVHCFMGYSRSATIVLSYLMRKEGLSLKEAKDQVMKLRNIGPNEGFLRQLRLFEKMGFSIDSSDSDYRAFALEKLTAKVRELSFGRKKITAFKDDPHLSGAPMQRALGLDPAMLTAENGESADGVSAGEARQKPRLLFRCRKCRRPLAGDASLLPHTPGRGKAFGTNSHVLNRSLDAFKKRRREGRGTASDESDEVCQEGLFFEPIEWMRDQILFLEGQITCPKPKCGAKLGHFNWVGQPCPCGHWVVPAFHLAASKVDKCVIEPADSGLRFGRKMTSESTHVDNKNADGKVTETGSDDKKNSGANFDTATDKTGEEVAPDTDRLQH